MKSKTIRTMSSIMIAILAVMITATGCKKDETIVEEQDINNTELTVNNYLLVATGQTISYDNDGEVTTGLTPGDAFYGQDANYLSGEEIAYQVNSDGTITDLNTGLMWQQVPTSATFTWQEAVDYCEDLELNGYDDWRMPSCKELYSISNFETGWPYINTNYFTLASGQISKDEQY